MPDFVATYTGDLADAAATSEDNENVLWSTCRRSTIDPGAVEGTQRVDSGAAAEIHKIYMDVDGGGPAEYEVGANQHGDLEFLGANGGELVFAKAEQKAADRTPAAGTIGALWQRTDTRQFRANKDATTVCTLVSINDGALRSKELPLESWTLGGTAPAAATKGTSPTTPALRFTATNQKIVRGFRVPQDYSGAADCKLRLMFALNQAEAANDDFNITCDMVSVTPAAANTLGQTSTQYTGTTDIGAITSDGSVFAVDVTLTYNDANNPIAPGDWVVVEIYLTNTTTIADALFLGGEFLYPFGAAVSE